MKLKVGFAGIGAMGLSHLKAVCRDFNEVAEPVAISSRNDTNIAAARAIAPGVKVYASDTELVRAEAEVIFVSTPNSSHAALALETIAAGKHLFLEKACGVTREECAKLRNAAQTSTRAVMVGHELRYSPYFQRIKSLVDAGEIGRPHMVWTREFRGPFQKKSNQWLQDNRLSGGCLVDKNCHHFDLMNWWIGAKPARVAAFGGTAVNRTIAGNDQAHDHATVSFEYENGVRGTLQVCLFALDFPGEDLEMGIVGDKGFFQTRLSRFEILQWRRGSGQSEPIVHKIDCKAGDGWGGHLGFAEMHKAFFDAIKLNKRPLTTVADCVDGTLLAIAAEESIKTGAIITV